MESGCQDGDESTLDVMRATSDWVQSAIDRPMVSEPGKKFCYDSPGMHLLSAILQQATGMTALDFARQNLFEPLGIHNVIWETDPQGYTRGWGDLHLLPEDAARIGFLWMHRGEWDGRQIVPQAWVLASSRAHSIFVGDDFGYGYGWWVSPVDVYASGRQGQRVRVIASLNTIVVTTGGGFDPGELDNFLIPALLHSSQPSPADQHGQAALAAAMIAVQQDLYASTAIPIPDTARVVSGRTYLCESNPVAIESVRILLGTSQEATIFLRMGGTDLILPVGLDGSYRQASVGAAYRGFWEDAHIFNFEAFDIGVLHRQLDFDGDIVRITLPELELVIACQAKGQ